VKTAALILALFILSPLAISLGGSAGLAIQLGKVGPGLQGYLNATLGAAFFSFLFLGWLFAIIAFVTQPTFIWLQLKLGILGLPSHVIINAVAGFFIARGLFNGWKYNTAKHALEYQDFGLGGAMGAAACGVVWYGLLKGAGLLPKVND